MKIAFSQPTTSLESISESEDELVKVKQVLYLLDKFAVSDEHYHEMSMLHPDMPQINRIKEVRTELNGLPEKGCREHLVHSQEFVRPSEIAYHRR